MGPRVQADGTSKSRRWGPRVQEVGSPRPGGWDPQVQEMGSRVQADGIPKSRRMGSSDITSEWSRQQAGSTGVTPVHCQAVS